MKRIAMMIGLCAAALPAQTFTTLHSFDGTDGAGLAASLTQGTDGNLYGTAGGGGGNALGCPPDCGTVFEITPAGALTTLYRFCAQPNCADGSTPQAGLVQATNGDFYGTTHYGGTAQCPSDTGCGTVFRIASGGVLTTLYSFCSQAGCADGELPSAGLIQASNGNLYGTTAGGGGANGGGTVFEITPGGTLTTLYRFCSQSECPDGSSPTAGLVRATNGDFYGTTEGGGANNGGTVFKITPGGVLTTLHSFNPREGPQGALVQATNGKFYGTTYYGGPSRDGTVFEITAGGTLTTIYAFCSQAHCTDGANPTAGLFQATDGNFYGTTRFGGASDAGRAGTVFKITRGGVLTTLYSLCSQNGCTDGENPLAGLFQATGGDLYGTTYGGGAIDPCPGNLLPGCGTIFSLSVGLGPFVETQPTSGSVGAAVKILGTDLKGATSVSFDGIAAVFEV